MYVVTREGVYKHDVYAVYSEQEPAIALAKHLASIDVDDYHIYYVTTITYNKQPVVTTNIPNLPASCETIKCSPQLVTKECELVYNCKKGDI